MSTVTAPRPRLNASRFLLRHSSVFVPAVEKEEKDLEEEWHQRADHHVPHSRGFASLIIINPASRIYSGNAGGHMA